MINKLHTLNGSTILQNFVNHNRTPNYRHFLSLQLLHVTIFYICIRTSTRNARTHGCIIVSRIAKSTTWIRGSYSQETFRVGLAKLNSQEVHKTR